MDGAGGAEEKAQALQQIPDLGAGKGVPVQCLRLEAETMGVSEKLEPVRAPGKNMVPEQADEEQKEQSTPSGPAEQQQLQQ